MYTDIIHCVGGAAWGQGCLPAQRAFWHTHRATGRSGVVWQQEIPARVCLSWPPCLSVGDALHHRTSYDSSRSPRGLSAGVARFNVPELFPSHFYIYRHAVCPFPPAVCSLATPYTPPPPLAPVNSFPLFSLFLSRLPPPSPLACLKGPVAVFFLVFFS